MPVDIERVKEFEEKYKNILFERVRKLCSLQTELLMEIDKMREYFDLESDLPNIGITLNNKIIELQHQFEDAGISMYSQKFEDYGPNKLNLVGTSAIGEAVIFDLIDYASRGMQSLKEYNEAMKELTNKREKMRIEKTSPIRKFLWNIRKFFMPAQQEELYDTQEEMDKINSYLLDYKNADQQLWNYNLRDNIIPSEVRRISEKGYAAFCAIPDLLEESINPDLQKLGLADLIPQLEKELIEEYKIEKQSVEKDTREDTER